MSCSVGIDVGKRNLDGAWARVRRSSGWPTRPGHRAQICTRSRAQPPAGGAGSQRRLRTGPGARPGRGRVAGVPFTRTTPAPLRTGTRATRQDRCGRHHPAVGLGRSIATGALFTAQRSRTMAGRVDQTAPASDRHADRRAQPATSGRSRPACQSCADHRLAAAGTGAHRASHYPPVGPPADLAAARRLAVQHSQYRRGDQHNPAGYAARVGSNLPPRLERLGRACPVGLRKRRLARPTAYPWRPRHPEHGPVSSRAVRDPLQSGHPPPVCAP